MDGVARCVSCFRRERRQDDRVVAVELAGGSRQPDVPGPLAAWRTLRRVSTGEVAPPVAVCAACGQPMVCVDGELPTLTEWRFTLPDGELVIGPDGHVRDVDEAEADRRVEEHHRPALEAGNTAGAVGLSLGLMVVAMGFGGLISLCDCPGVALTVAAPAGAKILARDRGAKPR